MNKKTSLSFCLFSLLCFLGSCSSEVFEEESYIGGKVIEKVLVEIPELEYDADTRTEFSLNDDDSFTMALAKDDTLGIFPTKGDQVSFPMTGSGTTFTFDGGGWGLKDRYAYAAYFPFSKANYFRTNNEILLDYTGQEQDGIDNPAHLGKYDFLAAGASHPQGDYLRISLTRMVCVVRLYLTVPDAGTYTYATIKTDEEAFFTKQNLSISGETPQVMPVSPSNKLVLALNEFETTEANQVVKLFMMAAPVDLTGKTLYVELRNISGDVYKGTLIPRKDQNLKANSIRKFDAELHLSDGGGEIPGFDDDDEIIYFADPIVRDICINNWDTNNDGLLSYAEAASVQSIGQVFNSVYPTLHIKSFDEFQYFTGVTSLEDNAFNANTEMTSIVLPESLKRIGEHAFNSNFSLEGITIPKNVTSIIGLPFGRNYNLSNITVDSENTVYDSRNDCNAIIETKTNTLIVGGNSTVIPNGIVSIGKSAFMGRSSLESITIPEGVITIEERAFSECENLSVVSLPNTLKTIEAGAFTNCNLSSLTIPAGVTTIEAGAFSGCNLNSLSIPAGVTTIAEGAFCHNPLNTITVDGGNAFYDSRNNCNAIIETATNILIQGCNNTTTPAVVTKIGNSAFAGCSFESITIPNRVTTIGDGAFSGCKELRSITIPNSVITMGKGIFIDCTSLTSITVPSSVTTIEDHMFSGCTNLTSITISGAITRIGSSAFAWSGIETFTIPESVTNIGVSPFAGCSNLSTITSLSTTPPSIEGHGFLGNTGDPFEILVPAPAVEAYKEAWPRESRRIKAIE